jgi:hypothetical protein
MDKHHLDQVVGTHIAEIAILHGAILKDPNYFPPTITAEVFASLPSALAEAINQYESDEEKSIALLSAITTSAAGLNGIKIPYRKKRYNCNLYQVIVGPPASNKGISIHSRAILSKVQARLKKEYVFEMAKYKQALKEKNQKDNQESIDSLEVKKSEEINIKSESITVKEKYDLDYHLEEPNQKHIILPSDISSAALVDLVDRNDGFGLIFDSEAQTILNTFKQDWGANLNSMLLKSFENEPWELARKSLKSMIAIPEPRLSVLLTGNPEHLQGLVKSITNGLYSRFCIYQITSSGWKDITQFENNKDYLSGYSSLSIIVNHINEKLSAGHALEFQISTGQMNAFNEFFRQTHDVLMTQIHLEYSSVVRRMGAICYRIAAILAAIRNDNQNDRLQCSDEDFAIALSLCSTLLQHSVYTFLITSEPNSAIEEFYKRLEHTFTRTEALPIANELGIKSRRMDSYLKELTAQKKIRKVSHGQYEKCTPAILQNLQFDMDDEDSLKEEVKMSPGAEELGEKVVAIESEFPQTEFHEAEIAQIAKLQDPFLNEPKELAYNNEKSEHHNLDWVDDVFGCTAYTEEELHQVLIRNGFRDNNIRVEQINLALSKNKLECNSGYYYHSSPCF